MTVRLTILCENSVARPFGLLGEHGFACYLETPQGNYLFDTGQGKTLIPNARCLEKDLTTIKALLISHGHYDHTGGLQPLLEYSSGLDIYAHPAIFTTRYWEIEGRRRDVGIPWRRDYLESLGARFQLQKNLIEVGPGVYLTGEIPRCNNFEKGDCNQSAVTPEGEIQKPDPLADDLSMVVTSQKGLILVLGGTHLGFAGEKQFEETLNTLDRYHIDKLGVSHCTGLPKAAQLASRLGDRFFFGNVGTVIEA